ncbi:protein FAM8A1-like [Mizuhopecten yessoensis]|uniref:Protein FAM8A1 n=1 Tax=Mizuhopecten yessoensis TaxID=6573 RepID=A0A210Q8W9_MIZYE|nr:protein FAM8A1-like [Mizuhopecten yessoensis]OWF45174.1 Protein FAM8A1 [Mizuhopecten yessoensis]
MASNENSFGNRKKHRFDLPPPLNTDATSFNQTTYGDQEDRYSSNVTDTTTPEYKNAREYARALQPWLYQYRLWNFLSSTPSMFPYQMMNCMHPMSPLTGSQPILRGVPTPLSTGIPQAQMPGGRSQTPPTFGGRARMTPNTNIVRGTEYIIPSLWKRVLAELVDFAVLFYMKIIVTVLILRQMGYLRDDNNILDVHLDLMPVLDFAKVDLDEALNFTSEIIALEIVNRVFITLFETLCIRQGYGSVGGATPGKRILGLKVVSCEEVIVPANFRNGRVIVIPAQNVGMVSALVRSTIKNFTMAFLFPACFTVFFFRHSRAAYDVIAKTIVVQAPAPHIHQHHQPPQ